MNIDKNTTLTPKFVPSWGKDFRFDPEKHEYIVDGVVWPSPTQLIKEFGIVDYSGAHFSEEAKMRGKAVHAAIQFFDDGDLDESTVHESLRGYLDAWKLFRSDHELNFIMSEVPLMSDTHMFCVTPDRVFKNKNGVGVLEIKTGETPEKALRLQTIAQLIAANEALGVFDLSVPRLIVKLEKSGSYKLKKIDDGYDVDFDNFLSLVKIHFLKRGK